MPTPKTEDWIGPFLDRHGTRYQPAGWPAAGTEDYLELLEDWLEAFDDSAVSEDEANRASRRMAVNPPQYNQRRDHLPAVMAVIRTMRSERQTADPSAMTRESAAAASKGCRHCDGGGLATVEHPTPDPIRRIPRYASAHCVCSLGRWMRVQTARQDEPTLRRIPDLADVLTGRTGWRYDAPQPEPDDVFPDVVADVKRRLAETFKPRPAPARDPAPEPAETPAESAEPAPAGAPF